MTQAEYKALPAEAKACVQICTDSYSKVMIFSQSDIEEKTKGSIDSLEPIVNFLWWRRGRVELPVQKQVARTYYKFSQLFYLARPASAGPVWPDQSIVLSQSVSTSGPEHPDFSAPNPDPSGGDQAGCAALFRQRSELLRWQLSFATCFTRWMAPRPAIL